MLRVLFPGILWLTAVFSASPSEAACDIATGLATKSRIPMVRSYPQCGWVRGAAPSRSTEAGVDACVPEAISVSKKTGECDGPGNCSGRVPDECPKEPQQTRFCWYDFAGAVGPSATWDECQSDGDCAPLPYRFLYCAPRRATGNCDEIGWWEAQPVLENFASRGSCTLMAASRVEEDCSQVSGSSGVPLGLPQRPCHLTTLKVRCRGILGQDGTPIDESDVGWSLRLEARATLDDPLAGEVTQIDFPVSFYFDTPRNGALKLDANSAEALVPLLGAANAALPSCTTLQAVRAEVRTPSGLTFAVPGLATHP